MHERELLLGQMLQVHVVTAGTSQGNESDALLIKQVNHRRAHLIIDKDTDDVVPVGQGGCSLVQSTVEERDGVPGGGKGNESCSRVSAFTKCCKNPSAHFTL